MRKRAGRPARFTMIANSAIDDEALDMTQLGLHTFLVRCKDGYDIDMDTLAKRRGPGRRALYTAMRALVERGYVVKIKFQDAGGKWATEVVIYDTPALVKEIEDLLEDFAAYRNVRVEPEWLDPRKAAEPEPLANEEPEPDDVPESPASAELEQGPEAPNVTGQPDATENPRSEPACQNRQVGDESTDEPACQNRQVGDRQVGDRPVGDRQVDSRQVENRQAKNLETNTNTNTKIRPSDLSKAQVGWKDGSKRPDDGGKLTEGMRFLAELGNAHPKLMITGKRQADQGLVVDELFARGWKDEVLWELLTRPLPQPLRYDVSAIIAKRLRDCLESPLPGPRRTREDETPTPRQYTAGTDPVVRRRYECEGQNGLCGRPIEAAGELCPTCAQVPQPC